MNENRFEIEEFFEASLVEEIMKEFAWPAPYQVIDDDFYAEIVFPECTLLMSDDGLGSTDLDFTSYKREEIRINIAVALWVRNLRASHLNLVKRLSVWPNEEDMKTAIRNTMIVLQAYFLPFITGNDDQLIEDAKNFH
jgi:hypothetical protein